MKVTDKIDHESATALDGQGIAILSNGKGSFAVLSPQPSSRYDGVFVKHRIGEVFRFVESIQQHEPVLEVSNRLWGVHRRRASSTGASSARASSTETWVMPSGLDAVHISCDRESALRIVLDCKAAYDNREWGRHYSVEQLPFGVLISFSKRNDSRDPPSPFGEYDLFVAIHSPGARFRRIESWISRRYDRDVKRNSPPFERYVFVAGSLEHAKEVVLGFGFSKSQALAGALRSWRDREKLVDYERARVEKWVHALSQVPERYDVGFASAANALDRLVVDNCNVYAGLPWFFQFWARDSAVSARALSIIGRHDASHALLVSHLKNIKDGLCIQTNSGMCLQSKSGNSSESIQDSIQVSSSFDGVLWTYVRAGEMLDAYPSLFSGQEKELLRVKLSQTIESIPRITHDGLILNNPKETWMDTDFEGDNRAGSRIEMQALALASMRLANRLSINAPEQRLLARTRKFFWNGSYLNDGRVYKEKSDGGWDYGGKEDAAIRPNVFIAAYVYPDLLTTKEWKSCMETVIPKLWLPWGGFSTIATDHRLFTSESTGEDIKSYHRGDSWFWINNMAAIVLHRLDKIRYKPYIDKILNASTNELLFGGAAGHHAELSSASHLSSGGCLSQAWSNAMYIELLTELFGMPR